jgi:hypothetical protein
MTPDFLSHYYEAARGPYRNLSHLAVLEAEGILAEIRETGEVFAAARSVDYLTVRRDLEDRVRALFMAKGGRPLLARPHYMVLGACPWLLDWYVDGRELRIPFSAFEHDRVSFTYGDTFPAMRLQDGKPYRGQVFTFDELPELIAVYGLPQEWNCDGSGGPDRYIEAQVWDDAPLLSYLAE